MLYLDGECNRVFAGSSIPPDVSERPCLMSVSMHAWPTAPNLLQRCLDADRLKQRWVSDITYIPTNEGWVYLAVILDLFSRRVVDWSMQPTQSQSLAQDALRMALMQRMPPRGLIHHSDRGDQYARQAFQGLLKANEAVCKMSRNGDCWDNAVMESFFRTLKTEAMERMAFTT